MDKKYLLIGCLCAIFVLAGIFSMLLKPASSSDSRRLQDFYTLPFADCCSGFDNSGFDNSGFNNSGFDNGDFDNISINISDDTNYSTSDAKTLRNVNGSQKVTR